MNSRLTEVKVQVAKIIKPIVRASGFELVRRHYYSPFPDIDALPGSIWSEPAEMPGVDLRIDAAVSLLQRDLQRYLDEFRPPQKQERPGQFHLDNGSYGSVDAEILYAMVRHAKPKRLFELGSGASSHVIAAAALVNASEGRPLEHEVFDPYPFTASPLGAASGPTVRAMRAEDIDAAEMQRLGPGDILFVDTTHTVKTGGDVTHIFLQLIPRLARGTWVHVHDIFLPYEYPRRWVTELRLAWAEQYLLQAFLAFNPAFQVVLPAHALARETPDVLSAAIPSFGAGTEPGAFWMRRL